MFKTVSLAILATIIQIVIQQSNLDQNQKIILETTSQITITILRDNSKKPNKSRKINKSRTAKK